MRRRARLGSPAAPPVRMGAGGAAGSNWGRSSRARRRTRPRPAPAAHSAPRPGSGCGGVRCSWPRRIRGALVNSAASLRSSTTGAFRKNRGLRRICSARSCSKAGSRNSPARTTMTVKTAPCTRLPAIREPPPPAALLRIYGLAPNRPSRNDFAEIGAVAHGSKNASRIPLAPPRSQVHHSNAAGAGRSAGGLMHAIR